MFDDVANIPCRVIINIAVNLSWEGAQEPHDGDFRGEISDAFAINSKSAKSEPSPYPFSLLSLCLIRLLPAGARAPVEHFCYAAGKELGEKGISVNNISLGPTDA